MRGLMAPNPRSLFSDSTNRGLRRANAFIVRWTRRTDPLRFGRLGRNHGVSALQPRQSSSLRGAPRCSAGGGDGAGGTSVGRGSRNPCRPTAGATEEERSAGICVGIHGRNSGVVAGRPVDAPKLSRRGTSARPVLSGLVPARIYEDESLTVVSACSWRNVATASYTSCWCVESELASAPARTVTPFTMWHEVPC
jgi:hypothetical protein